MAPTCNLDKVVKSQRKKKNHMDTKNQPIADNKSDASSKKSVQQKEKLAIALRRNLLRRKQIKDSRGDSKNI